MTTPIEGSPPQAEMKTGLSPLAWFTLSAVCLLLTAYFLNSQSSRNGIVGIDAGATRGALEDTATELTKAAKMGDAAAAIAMMTPLIPLMDKIGANVQTNDAMRRCQLAASHLADGVLSVAQGGEWNSKNRFEAALPYCK